MEETDCTGRFSDRETRRPEDCGRYCAFSSSTVCTDNYVLVFTPFVDPSEVLVRK